MATISAIVGAMVAAVGFQTLVASLPLQRGFGGTVSLGWQAFATAFALALAVGLGVAAAPVRQVLRGRLDVRERSEEGLRRGTRRMHSGLIAAQVTLAVMLVSGASLLIRSVERIRSIETGFDATGVVTIDLVREAGVVNADLAATNHFYERVLERVEALPGVTGAGFTNRLPVRDGGWQGSVNIEGRADLSGAQRPSTLYRAASPDYLGTLGIQVRTGRGIEATDRIDGALVALVSESFARKIWPNDDPIGKRVSFGGTQAPWRTVVGVVEETRMISMMGETPLTLWVPLSQMPWGTSAGAVLVVKGSADPASVITSVRSIVSEIDRGVAIARTGTMESVVDVALAEPLQLRFFLGLFAALALLLGAVGVYGVVSYAVTRRRAEFGIRMALGAAPGRVLGLVVGGGMMPVVIGAVAGVLASIAMSRLVRGFLYEVSPTDSVSLAGASGVVLLAGVIAALVPAWRAGRVSPVESLRAD
jgi:predicted permease